MWQIRNNKTQGKDEGAGKTRRTNAADPSSSAARTSAQMLSPKNNTARRSLPLLHTGFLWVQLYTELRGTCLSSALGGWRAGGMGGGAHGMVWHASLGA
jgi:hypothetical protein